MELHVDPLPWAQASAGHFPAVLSIHDCFASIKVGHPERDTAEAGGGEKRRDGPLRSRCNVQNVPTEPIASLYTQPRRQHMLESPRTLFCYSSPIGVMRCDGGLARPTAAADSASHHHCLSVAILGAKIVSCTTTTPSSWAAPPLSLTSVMWPTPRFRDGPAALRSAAPPSPSRRPRGPS